MATQTPAAPSSPSSPAPAPSGGSSPGQGGGAQPQRSGGAERHEEPFDARADAADLFAGPDSASQERGEELAEEALAGDGDEQLEAAEDGPDQQQEGGAEDGPLSIGGIEFPNAAALEQYVRTNQGRLVAAQQHVQIGAQWERYATQLEDRLAQLEQGQGGPMPERPQAAPQAGQMPRDFVEAYHQTFGDQFIQKAEAAFLQAVNAQDEAGVKQGLHGFMSETLAGVARLMQAREAAIRAEFEPVKAQMSEQAETSAAIQAHQALVTKAASLRNDDGSMMFPDIFTDGPSGPQFNGAEGREIASRVSRAMVKLGLQPSMENFGLAYATVVGLRQLSGAPEPGPRSAAGGDPTLSGAGVGAVGSPRRVASPRDPYGLPKGPSRGRVMGIDFGR